MIFLFQLFVSFSEVHFAMKLSVIFRIVFLYDCTANALIYSGSCPSVLNQAKDITNAKPFIAKILGEVSTSAATLNIFHNQYEKLECVSIAFSTTYLDLVGLLLKQCKSLEKFATRYGIGIQKNQNSSSGAYKLQYSFAPDYTCDAEYIRDEIYILDYVESIYMLIWGCWKWKDDFNEQGVLILVDQNVLETQDYLTRSIAALKLVNPYLVNDLNILQSDFNEDCVCDNCDYLMKCDLRPDVCGFQRGCKIEPEPSTELIPNSSEDGKESTTSSIAKTSQAKFIFFFILFTSRAV